MRRVSSRTNDRRSPRPCSSGNTDEPDWVADEATYADKNISLRLGTIATRIDRNRKVVVASRTEYPYDKLLIATGSAPRRLDVPGADLEGLLTLRTLEESLALRERFTEGATIVIVGAGWIGCEAAAAARQHGAKVTSDRTPVATVAARGR